MIFEPLALEGVWRIRLDPRHDDRGFFARTFCGEEFAAHGLPSVFEQSSLSRNQRRGTLRGMHYQPAPHAEAKLVRCVRGSVFDVVLDLRQGAVTFGRWISEVLTAEVGTALYIAEGLAHGFQSLEDESDVLYQITPSYKPGFAAGVRWNDPAFDIKWPLSDPILSDKDAGYRDWAA